MSKLAVICEGYCQFCFGWLLKILIFVRFLIIVIMNQTLKHIIYFSVVCLAIVACNKDDIPDPYQPVTLPKISRLDFINGNDSSVFIFDANMILTSGRDNNATGIYGYEWYTVQYSDSEKKHLAGAVYNVSKQQDGHRDEYKASYSRDERNMLSKVTRESDDWKSRSFSFGYDDQYRLSQLTMNDDQTVNRYTIVYDDRSNVTSVEVYQKVSTVEGTTKWEFSGYDSNPNPFRFLVNAFYAPVFSSNNGPITYNTISSSLGLLLSQNNPAKVISYTKTGDDWEKLSEATYSYEYGSDNYPVSISGGLSLSIEYHK